MLHARLPARHGAAAAQTRSRSSFSRFPSSAPRLSARAAQQSREAPPTTASQPSGPEDDPLEDGSAFLRPEYDDLSDEQIEELVDAAAGLISVLPELRPLDPKTFNAGYEVWKAVAAVPPADRYRIIEELEPGAIRNLWKASMGRYALDDARAREIYGDYAVWEDLPSEPGEVLTYAGVCERLTPELLSPPLPGAPPGLGGPPRGGAAPLLQPAPGSWRLPQRRFTQRFFRCARTGKLHSRVALGLAGPFETFWAPIYNTVDVELTLTPVEADAGADIIITYPWTDEWSRPLDLARADLPAPLWPAPRRGPAWSPLSRSGRDYVRLAGPGLMVGCAYAAGEDGGLSEDAFVYFALARVA